jgi:sulfonate transport system permease protein
VFVGLILPASLLIAWQLLADSGRISTLLFPSPTTIFDTTLDLAQSGILWDNAWVSIKRVMWGMLIGCSLGMAFGVLVGMARSAETLLNPSVQMIRMVPHLALTSLFVLWFGIGETSKVLLIAKGVFFPVYIAMYLGFRNVDAKLVEVARVLQFSPLDLFRKILLPGSLSHLFIGLRLSMGVAWGTLVIAEMIAASSGLGYMMVDARSFSDTPVVFAGILTFAVLGIASDLLIRAAEKRTLRWSSRYTG